MTDLLELPYHALRPRLGRDLSVEEVVEAYLDRIERTDGVVRAYLTVTPETARAQARAWDERIRRGEELPPLVGFPVALKDNLCTRGVRTTCGSRILENFVPPYDATAVRRLVEAGAVVLGKTNLDEFAMGSSTEHSAFFATRNPWNPEYVPGGSSGGSAAAVAARSALGALGSDTGGSIRLPAALCGVVGLKPTYGRVSRYGLVAYASSLDQIGPIARDVRDCALLLQAIAGKDPMDATSMEVAVPDYVSSLKPGVRGLRIGVPLEAFGEGLHPAVREAVQGAVRMLEREGAAVEEVRLPTLEYALPAYYLIACAEVSSNLARYDGVAYGYRSPRASDLYTLYARTRAEGFGPEAKRRIMLGTFALSAGYYEGFYRKAQQVRTLVRRDFERCFERVDLLVTPVSPTPGFRLGERLEDPLQMYLVDIYTLPVNLAGLPAISIPCGFWGGLPLGVQLIGRAFDEETVLRAAYTYEQVAGVAGGRPRIVEEER
ncbi:MAG: Asp-tRNA(Asn)/Glu-tRNA(Gln) amidotransferase subunit GatA [Armatimonadota bacterium]|nr:Asp-tRNA(Asn)/Glu-tRNA(Gln) amidotransferase subunit GatA [Armatimonadota bacterium]MDR7439340.1 Asp-tRNA(Asn)/Glu-tRNA(Gln) amidotransferase subunit GatA [Armatimonadota bacterium]MDR7562030.1 Asp-tRNA(Asn)/Glu-tRNA(Gln) amidotransferase subunit GatA [Armatimonadota bacterium]MDR7566996.1 Asp-tRNA(Asn)/Glu-tRNA(Gln) amidotransferase subunit GatA [Armatimonadota bacterium]MDR7601143.1 Asp-tRNA(Asn)/Glu-tRNA(Gln) amidotransferase subunit GatA [Armatimonadota bacterium]